MMLLSSFTSVNDMAKAAFPIITPALKVCPWLLKDKFDSSSKAKDLTLHTKVIHGTADEIVPFAQGKELAKILPRSEFVSLEGAGHNDLWASAYESQVLKAVRSFIFPRDETPGVLI
eukprot:CAMPEP_0184298576 /NCGR_PEP_ID=MMETSP1049-20130417/9366_1 /TAXON_ID=77928 /ORGANISM="Proteomonas sulcata, Strain CCMP704" /LENGTH=116 /DNA_ID=CAMNT_0026608747 /DNA_START=157 /DNA_END=507 /DNA_ORIENTATION=+